MPGFTRYRRLMPSFLVALLLLLALAGPGALALTQEEAVSVGGDLSSTVKKLEFLKEAGAKVKAAVPNAWADLQAALTHLGQATGPRAAESQRAWIALSLLLLVALVLALRWATRRGRQACLGDPVRARGALRLLGFEFFDRLAVAGLAYLLIEFVFNSGSLPDLLGVALLWSAARWWVVIWMLEILLRPNLPEFRLLPMGEPCAKWLKGIGALVSYAGILGISIMPVLLRSGLPVPSGQVIALVQGLVVAGGGLVGLLVYARLEIAAFRQQPEGRSLRMRRLMLGLAALIMLLLWLSWTAGVIVLKFSIFHSLVWSLRIAFGMLIVDAVLRLEVAQARSELLRLWIPFLQRSLRVAATLAIGILLAELWLVDELAVVSAAAWEPVRRSLVIAALTLVAGYALWRYLNHWMEERLGEGSLEGASDDEEAEAKPATRLATILPLLRLVLGVAIPLVAVMIALSQLGVDIGPLLAAASVLGLAISFGSQALVKDVVSGIFFMADDAFRRGEYIDTGGLKGSVEKLSLRSLRLRHQNGQIHTIPYGQLSSVTNFSRDYQTLKFNLRLARDADIEKARKVVKKVGQEMMEDAELGKELLMPLKLQGVAEIAENALVVRLKFTARPTKPSWVQREALKRVYRAFSENGIAFASSTITVQGAGGSPIVGSELAAGAAGAASAAASVAAAQAVSR